MINTTDKGLKELVKSGELTARHALESLSQKASADYSLHHAMKTRTWNWLCNKIKTQKT